MKSLDELKEALTSWRQEKTHGSQPIPDHIWEEAARLAVVHGRGSVARQLGLSTSGLKSRVENLTSPPQIKMAEIDKRPAARSSQAIRSYTNQNLLASISLADGARLDIFEGASALAIQALGNLMRGAE